MTKGNVSEKTERLIHLTEGKVKKGGINPPSDVPRPAWTPEPVKPESADEEPKKCPDCGWVGWNPIWEHPDRLCLACYRKRESIPTDQDASESLHYTAPQGYETVSLAPKVCARCNALANCDSDEARKSKPPEPERPRTICAECKHVVRSEDEYKDYRCAAKKVIVFYDQLSGRPIYSPELENCAEKRKDEPQEARECPDYEAKEPEAEPDDLTRELGEALDKLRPEYELAMSRLEVHTNLVGRWTSDNDSILPEINKALVRWKESKNET